jgi:cupin fold WbuC family metalloprotein
MKLFSSALLDELAAKATASPRGRANHNIHIAADDPVQRFFVVANRQSYFRPHRHRTKSELAFVVRGGFDVLTFEESGRMLARYVIDAGGELLGYETPRATWHTLIARTDGSTFLEIKEGPYDQATAAEFAPWAPAEGDARVPQFLELLRAAQPGTSLRF